MFELNRFETKQVMEGSASGCARKYGNECPHKPGSEIVLTSRFLDSSGRSIPFAKANVVSVRPGTVGEFRRDPMIAEMDGYPNGEVWFGQLSQMYRGMKDSEKIFHIRFMITDIDKKAGRRGNIPNPEK